MEEFKEETDRGENFWQDRFFSAEASLLYMYKSEMSTDVILKAKKNKESSMCFSAHKLVLACRSPMFADMFFNKPINSSTIVFDNVYPRSLDIILWYIYSDSLEDASIGELIEAFKVAKRFEIYSFCDICAEKFIEISSDINASSVCSVLHIADFANCKKLRKKCLKLIMQEPEDSLSTEGFLSLDKETVWFILQGLSSDVCQKVIMKSVIRWMQKNNESDKKYLSLIDLSNFTTEDFLSIVEEFPNFFTGKEVTSILLKFMKPKSSEYPQWCKFSETKTINQTFFQLEGMELIKEKSNKIMELIKEKSENIKTDCRRKFLKSSFFSLHDFYQEILLLVNVSSNMSKLVMLELAFGSEYVPLNHLMINLLLNIGIGGKMQSMECLIIPSLHHYYLLLPSDLIQRANKTFKILLSVRAKNLNMWDVDGPVSNHQYRVACLSNVSNTIDTISTNIFLTVQIKPYGDWLLFVDPKTGDKKCIITTLFFDTIENIEKYMNM